METLTKSLLFGLAFTVMAVVMFAFAVRNGKTNGDKRGGPATPPSSKREKKP